MGSPVPSAAVVPSPVDEVHDAPADQCRPRFQPIRLCRPNVCMTLGACTIASTFSAVALFFFSISEQGFLLEPKTNSLVIFTRLIGWLLMYYLPVYLVATCNLRGFFMYGTTPSDNSLVCLGTGLSLHAVGTFADKRRVSRSRAVLGILFAHLFQLAVNISLVCVYIGDELQHLGLGFIYISARLSALLLDYIMRPWLIPDPLCPNYAYKFAPRMLGVSVAGFYLFTAAYVALRHNTNVWIGLTSPVLLSLYKMISIHVVKTAFTAGYVTQKATRQAYAPSGQGAFASTAIAAVQAHGEAARLVWIIYGVVNGDTDSDKNYLEYLVPIAAGAFWNIIARAGLLDRLWDVMTCGWLAPSRCRVLLHDSKLCMSYPRFFAIASIFCARFCALGEVLPNSQTNLGLALLATLGAQWVEDFICLVLQCTGLRLGRRRRQMFAEDFQAGRASSVVPSDEVTRATSVKEEYDRILAAFDFAYQLEMPYDTLPFWMHFVVVALVQLNTLMALIFFVNGLNYMLGLCATAPYYGPGHARLWWPITDAANLCAAG